MIEENLVAMLQTFGFPVVVAGWFMFRLEKILKSNTEALNGLISVIGKLKRKV